MKKSYLLLTYLFLLSILPFLTSSSFSFYIIENESFVKSIPFKNIALWSPIWAFLLTFGICTTTFTCLAGGYLYGWKVILLILPTYLFAQSLGFFFIQKLNSNLLEFLKSKNKYPSFLTNIVGNESKIVFFSRLSPVLPFALMNMILGLLKIDFKTFTYAGILGMLPRTIFCIWLGTQVQSYVETQNQSLSFWFVSVSIIVSFVFLIKILAKKSNPN